MHKLGQADSDSDDINKACVSRAANEEHAIMCPANQSAERHKHGFAADQSGQSGKGRAQSAVLVLLLFFSPSSYFSFTLRLVQRRITFKLEQRIDSKSC